MGRKQQSVLWEENNSPCCGKKTTVRAVGRKKRSWLDIAIANMNAGPVQVFQTCMRVGASLIDMTAGRVQLLKTRQMVGCNCYRHC